MPTAAFSAIDDEFFHDQGGYVRTHAATVPDLAAGDAAGPLSRAGLSRARPCPAHQQDAGRHLSRARPLREHVRARAADGCDRGARSASIASRCAGAISSPRRRCPIRGRWRRSAPRSCSIPATMPGCSTRRWRRSTGTSCTSDLARRRAAGELVGAGPCASSSRRAGSARSTACASRSMPSGLVEVVTGAASVGQGVETVVAQICADALGVDYRRVRVVHGRTDRIAFGQGAFASRVTVMTGEATRLAAVEVRAKAIEVAAELLQQPAGRARHRRRQGRAQGRRGRPVDDARRDRQGAGAGVEAARRRARRASPPTAGSTPIT